MRKRTGSLALLLLALCSVGALDACRRQASTLKPSLSDQAEAEAPPPKPTKDQLPPDIGEIFQVKDHAWLCKRTTDLYLTNRERTKEDQDFFDSRIAQGHMVELAAGTRVQRQHGGATKLEMRDGTERLYVRVEVLGDAFKEDDGYQTRGLVALDSLQKVR